MKYEDFCRNHEELFPEIVSFIESPLEEPGAVGAFLQDGARADEFELHGSEITTKRVERWKSELDEQLLEEAEQFFDKMSGYVSFWGYEK